MASINISRNVTNRLDLRLAQRSMDLPSGLGRRQISWCRSASSVALFLPQSNSRAARWHLDRGTEDAVVQALFVILSVIVTVVALLLAAARIGIRFTSGMQAVMNERLCMTIVLASTLWAAWYILADR